MINCKREEEGMDERQVNRVLSMLQRTKGSPPCYIASTYREKEAA